MNICIENNQTEQETHNNTSEYVLLENQVIQIIPIDNLNLSHPYFVYPNTPMCEYTRYEIYNQEVKRFYCHLENLKAWTKNNLDQDNFYSLNCLLIGSAMEQAIRTGNAEPYSYFQWQQLFPSYIHNFISAYAKKTNNTYVNLIIISPDKIFSDEFYKEPIFTSNTDYQFEKISNRKYIHSCVESNLKINVDIFNCPFPSFDSRKEFIEKINDLIKRRSMDFTHLTIKSYTQTLNDIEFINRFYMLIDEFMQLNNGFNNYMIINSWATFKNLEGFSGYKMFEKLLELANKNNILATEWGFQDKNFITQIVSTFHCDHVITNGKNTSSCKKSSLFKNITYTLERIDFGITAFSYYNRIYVRLYNIYFDGGIFIYEL